jgi:hypothetical protein
MPVTKSSCLQELSTALSFSWSQESAPVKFSKSITFQYWQIAPVLVKICTTLVTLAASLSLSL